MEIIKLGSQPSVKGPEDWFTGPVRRNHLFQPNGHRRTGAAKVTFEPGARTADGGPIEEIRPGDIVWFAPGEKHWHGASATMAMTHIATQEELKGKVVDWMEKVSDGTVYETRSDRTLKVKVRSQVDN